MPVHNEQACIERVLQSWLAALERLGCTYRVMVLDDGSTDDTPSLLDRLAQRHGALQVIHKSQSGHGPTVLEGYWLAVDQAHWVFQVDSDDELRPDDLERFWHSRGALDFVLGVRTQRRQAPHRLLLSYGSRLVLRWFFGRNCPRDPNVPFRLMRSTALRPILMQIPPCTFAPNLALSALLGSTGQGFKCLPVQSHPQPSRRSTLRLSKLWFYALRPSIELLRLASTARRLRPEG